MFEEHELIPYLHIFFAYKSKVKNKFDQFCFASEFSMKFLFVLIFCVLPLINAKSTLPRETTTCIADYLKSIGMLSASPGLNYEPNQVCISAVQIRRSQNLEKFQSLVLSDEEVSEKSDCIMEKMKKSSLENILLLADVLDTLEEEEKLEKTKFMKNAFISKYSDTILLCLTGDKFNEAFEALFEKSSSEEESDPKEDYCIRKYVVENNLISAENVSLPINPQNIDTTGIDCNVLNQKALKDTEEKIIKGFTEEFNSDKDDNSIELNPNMIACVQQLIRQGNYIDKMLQFDYLQEMNLNGQDKEQLRNYFNVVMIKLAQNTVKCLL